MTDKNILAGNWKMNLGPAASSELAGQLASLSGSLVNTEIWLAPSFICIPAVIAAVKDSTVKCGSQNVHWEEKGACTGELSVAMLQEAGCDFAIVGHSERRHDFGESNELVSKRALGSLSRRFTTILCIGETLEQRENGDTEKILIEQLEPVLSQIAAEQIDNMVIAYEPVWAIGTGKVATLDEIQGAHAAIEGYWKTKVDRPCVPILYGGSVKPENFAGIINLDLVSGALIGGASLSYDKMKAMADIAEKSIS